jgi:thiamine biosynthesis lipoprotein
MADELTLTDAGAHLSAGFRAMASPCEVLVETSDRELAARLATAARDEVLRIESKYSRYRADSALSRLNASGGTPSAVDDETADLLDFAARCWAASDGAFDPTSGVLRAVWRFDGSDRVPDAAAVAAVLPRVGWDKLDWSRPRLILPAGMELDFGGFGKEYAADRAAGIARRLAPDTSTLVNLGGDLVMTRPRQDGTPWRVGIERPDSSGSVAQHIVELKAGALCTSGDARRFLFKDGVRYGHILDPRSGWPVRDAPRSVTVAAPTCTEAGLLCTLSMLAGPGAESFLAEQGMPHWVIRD